MSDFLITYEDESGLEHHGILGQKWGIRRYQNPDGSLTDLGRKHYGYKDAKKDHSNLKKEIRKRRKEKWGLSNSLSWNLMIGPNSEKLYSEYLKKYDDYIQSDEYKQWQKKWNKLDRDYDKLKIDPDEYSDYAEKLLQEQPKKDFLDLTSSSNDYVNKGGLALSIAYLKDLGFSESDAKKLAKNMANFGYTLGGV